MPASALPPAADEEPGAPAAPQAVAGGNERWTLAARWVPAAVALAHLALGLSILYRGHPTEDAYILFDYVKNLVAGHGIVFWPGGPHAEGATDFLWLLLIAGLVRCGLDVAVAAACLNAAGAGLTSYLCVRIARRVVKNGPQVLVLSVLSGTLVLTGGGISSHVGFSASAYSSLALLLLALWVELPPRRIHRILWAGFAVALFRPDGAILFAGFAILGLVRAWRGRALRIYLSSAALAVLAGLAYLFARWWYFGELLPLPLYVKGHSAAAFDLRGALADPMRAMPGLEPTWAWLRITIGPGPLALGTAVLAAASFKTWSSGVRTLAAGFLPYLAHVAALCFAQQSQNFAFRFHAPAFTALFFGLILAAAHACAAARSARWRAAACAVALLAVVPGFVRACRYWPWILDKPTYLDTLAPEVGRLLAPGRTLALTEAGRLSYWTNVRVEDIVGLNNPHTARVPPSPEYVRSLDPDIVMFYCDPGTFGYGAKLDKSSGQAVLPLDAALLADIKRPEYREVFEHGLARWGSGLIPEHVASLTLARYLYDTRAYDLYAVKFARGFTHVWGLRRGLPEAPAIVAAMRRAAAYENYETYAQAAGLWRAQAHGK